MERRSFLRGVALASVAAIPASSADAINIASTNSAEWDAAVAAEKAAHAEMHRQYDLIVKPACAGHSGLTDEIRHAEAAWAEFVNLHCDEVDRLLATPAPDVQAVAYKMEVAKRVELFHDFAEAGALIHADLVRLSKGA